MKTKEFELREFPADVQDMLRDRAVKEGRPVAEIVKDYALEVAKQMVAAAANQGRAA